jgi:hypothetical protein
MRFLCVSSINKNKVDMKLININYITTELDTKKLADSAYLMEKISKKETENDVPEP